jgi:hypothetical protein
MHAWVAWRDDRIPFDSDAWKEADGCEYENPVRFRMVDDLFRRHKIVGLSRPEIEELLGPPTHTNLALQYDYAYRLGPDRASYFRMNVEYLGIIFEENRVVAARIVCC